MKNKFIKFSLLLALVGSGFSCSKQIDEAYLNPNASTKVPVEEILPNLISSMVGNYAGHGTSPDARYIGQYVQQFSYSNNLSNFDRMGYTNSAADVAQSTFRMHYYDIGQNNMKMIEWATEDKKWDYVGVGQAIFAWSWLTVADFYAELIVKEAFNTSQITFKYDTQEDAYNVARDYALKALENLNKTGDGVSQTNLAKGDAYMYNGDVNKWKKFAHGILARYYNHFSNKTALYKPDSVIYHANLSILDNADNAMVKFQATNLSATNNFWGPLRNNLGGATQVNPTAIRQGAYMANLVNGTNPEFGGAMDPRAWYMLRGNANGTIVGVPGVAGQQALAVGDRPENFYGGLPTTNTAPAVQNGTYIFRNEAPIPVLTASEIHFIKAEAAFRRGGDRTAAWDAYKEGISKNFDMLTTTYNVNIKPGMEITPASKAAYMALPAVVPPTPAGLNLSKIMLQKYIALFAHGALETWMDMRRYHYTDVDPSTGNQVYRDFAIPADLFPDNGGLPVQRMRPRFNSEYVWNILELQRIGATGLDYHVKPMWITTP
ncbi:MAG: SusD/RagB family nutrient-binding outer membrane lipoprotein [Sphingobacteriales bacterium]|nr:MAG: SusD/RagB family nutrient-binding outer membrane lipoprotein [Sphingobacteriales bacterium]